MKKVIIDSDIIIDYLRTKGGIFEHLINLSVHGKIEIYISVITVLEITAGISGSKDEKFIKTLFSFSNIIPINYEIASLAGKNKSTIRGQMNLADYLIATSAIHLGFYLATKNIKHFSLVPNLLLFPTSPTPR